MMIKKLNGESYGSILRYFFPELITTIFLYSLIGIIDSKLIGMLKAETYAIHGIAGTLFQFIAKLAEGLPVGMVILSGEYNGMGNFKKVAKIASNSFWVTMTIGILTSFLLYFSALSVYKFYGVPDHMTYLGMSFMKLRSISVFFTFFSFSLMGFLRGIKNTKTPMVSVLLGSIIFLFFDYALILGKFGFPSLGLAGSAIASIIQYASMTLYLLLFVLFNKDIKNKYNVNLFEKLDFKNIKELLLLSWPIMIDKGIMAISHIWLTKMVCTSVLNSPASISSIAQASFVAIKDLHRIGLMPTLALAQVITILVSNDIKLFHWKNIFANIKRVLIISNCLTIPIIIFYTIFPALCVNFFDKYCTFSSFASKAIVPLNILLYFDVLQIVFSAALRGASQVKVVMWTRVIVSLLFFAPISYFLAKFTSFSEVNKLILIFGSFYIGNLIMVLAYVHVLGKNKEK